MANDYTVKVISDQHVPQFTRAGTLANLRRVAIMVGQFGPYYHDFQQGQDTAIQVRQWIQQQQQDVQQINS